MAPAMHTEVIDIPKHAIAHIETLFNKADADPAEARAVISALYTKTFGSTTRLNRAVNFFDQPILRSLLERCEHLVDERGLAMINYLRDQRTTFGESYAATYDEGYAYEDITSDLKSRRIRLLKLHPRTERGMIECSLEIHSLAGRLPRYEAISYVWGKSPANIRIVCDNSSILVSRRVAAMLSRLRLRKRCKYLWIDAICIDQTNVDEKAVQIPLMQEIYSKAYRVIVWLGGEDWRDAFGSLGQKTFKLLKEFAASKGAKGPENDKTRDFQAFTEDVRNDGIGEIPEDESGVAGVMFSTAATSVEYILEREWFDRIWCVQEIVMAQKALVFCGPDAIKWDVFRSGLLEASASDSRFKGTTGALRKDSIAERKLRAFAALERPGPTDNPASYLLRVLIKHRSKLSTDPRDKVYALLGLVQQHLNLQFPVSYNEPFWKLSMRTAEYILRGTENLDLFMACTGPAVPSELPSWAPDWSYTRQPGVPFPRGKGVICSYREAHDCMRPLLKTNSKALKLRGHIVDTIDALGDCLQLTSLDTCEPEAYQFLMDDKQSDQGQQDRFKEIGLHLVAERIYALIDDFQPFFSWEQIAFDYTPVQVSQPQVDNLLYLLQESHINNAGTKDHYFTGERRRSAYFRTLCAGRLPEGSSARRRYEEWEDSVKVVRYAHGTGIRQLKKPEAAIWYISQDVTERHKIFASNELTTLLEHAYDRRFAKTRKGYYCLVPEAAELGDSIALFHGGNVPTVIRDSGDMWQVVGEAYVHGIMHGEAWRPHRCKTFAFR